MRTGDSSHLEPRTAGRLPWLLCLALGWGSAVAVACGGGGSGPAGQPSGATAGSGSSGSPAVSGASAPDASLSGASGQDQSGSGASGSVTGGSGASGAGGGGISGGTGSVPDEGGSSGVDTGDGGNPVPDPNRVRTVLSFDRGWLFFKGDAVGADQATFADTAWRALNVPHDWSIEGPFDMNAPTTGRGAYLPSGVGWYRKHFTLPQGLSGKQVFIDFDGVMANSDVYVNGFHLGKRPYGYIGFRYDMTGHVMFGGADNVVSVKCDTSVQPASRYYAGAGINRHVRVHAADPAHIDHWATYVTTPGATASSATVHVTTAVVNGGSAALSVTVQGVVSDPSGTALAPVSAPAQSIAAGATAKFAFDVPVASPKLWDPSSPNMYRLVTNVQVAGVTVDDDVTPFGIRTLTFDGTMGMLVNGKSIKLKGLAVHQEVSGLGVAVPMRAMQRRFAQFKSIGANAIRTAHNPVAPEVLDLADRMGLFVMDEFFDTWATMRYSDKGDYSAYFNTWYQIDLADIVKRDRNHPSIALYSLGNEIRDSISVRSPLATTMVGLCHQLDPGRNVTQALFTPLASGDVGGATRTILDVFGGNYHIGDVTAAIAMSPVRAGVLTEDAPSSADWATVMGNPGLTGLFIWSGADYLGEAVINGSGGATWPQVGLSFGLMDSVGTLKPTAHTFQGLWGVPVTPNPPTGTTASKVVLTPDHAAITADLDDVSYVKATVADGSGNVVTSASNPVTFSISGPGTIIAVDSGSLINETYRGNVRKAYQGVAFAIVQANGAGTITVTAASPGLTGSMTTVQSTAGPFVPCSGGCN